MITEDYCSYELSKLLKEKGFDEFSYYGWDEQLFDKEHPRNFSLGFDSKEHWISCPTQSMAMKWLREVHGIFIAINNDDLDFNWQCYDLINRGSTLDPKILSESYAGYKTYKEAVEASIKYALENLI